MSKPVALQRVWGWLATTSLMRQAKTIGRIEMSYLVAGQHVYGHAEDLATAKKNFQQFGGRLSKGYTVFHFCAHQTFKFIDGLGRVWWDGDGEPTMTEVKARGV